MAANSTKSKQEPTIEDLADQLEVLRAEISRLTELAVGVGQSGVEQVSGQAQQRAAELGAKIKHDAKHLRSRAEDVADEVVGLMHERPATAVGLVALLGFLVGMAVSRR